MKSYTPVYLALLISIPAYGMQPALKKIKYNDTDEQNSQLQNVRELTPEAILKHANACGMATGYKK